MTRNNLIRRVVGGTALVGSLVLGACAGPNPNFRGFDISRGTYDFLAKSKYTLSEEESCQVAKANGGFYIYPEGGGNAQIEGDSLFDAKTREKVEMCYVNRVEPGKQTHYKVFAVQKPNGSDIRYVFNETDNAIKKVTVMKRDIVKSFYREDLEVMKLAREKVEYYLESFKRIEQEKKDKRIKDTLDAMR